MTPPPPPVLRGIFVDTAWLEARRVHAGLRVVDLRERDAHASSHIPGAVQLDLARLGTTRDGCDNVLLVADEFADLMGELGIGSEHVVVAYDDQWGLAAARLVWALHRYGHEAAAVLQGGWDRWTEEGRSVSDQRQDPARAAFQATPIPSVSADLPWLSQHVPGVEPKLLDTRTQVEYNAGHLPNAILWDWFNAVPEGSWDSARDPAELRAAWEALGLDPSQEVVVYCRSGMRAAHTYVVLKHAGYTRVRLYDGSWQEWSMNQ